MDFRIADADSTPILGLQAYVELNLIKRVHLIGSDETTAKIINQDTSQLESPDCKFVQDDDVFTELGKFPSQCKISVHKNVPPWAEPPRRQPQKIAIKLKATLESLMKRGIIQKVEEPNSWVHNLVVVEEPNGTLRRITTIEQLIEKLLRKMYYSVIDLKDGFWQIELDRESSELCTFSTPWGCYKFLQLPFGISCTPEKFQELNERVFGDIDGGGVYLDDILVAAESLEEHNQIVTQVLQRARAKNIKFNPEKLQYRVPKVNFMVHGFTKSAMGPDCNSAIT
ncbi:hypothetical protein PR048_023396 [Dryococelus australis]|uniref:Reverse transcriptase domain-containing protein n=1 Tax=Dryococelus australis TaxID=614101 RepID=A0ABQ9GTZ0_9NEOP|nr:hypothetical protein PR048_023396 [Dryococelus australis]